ncbi:transcription-repair coupling factor [Asticcacaulis biprosthecium C19]|uniref:Transcription-repair-coupling factor n=1 Tax=Asticcacaulis biprosthecium C19 TaxID=715226 RepID=F4QQU4_9CAUL|nr:transcription-repair coupling factor [Asticcacaulis biprosthecium]EGF90581.1 transcription-repair coupling factor [Asticcacaulis biprosthecium C19]
MTTLSEITGRASSLTLSGSPEGYESLVAADLARAGGVSVFIARDFGRMNAVAEALKFFAPELDILSFPAWDCLPYDRLSPTPGVIAQRMYALSQLSAYRDKRPEKPVLFLTTASAMAQRVPPRSIVDQGRLSLKPGLTIDMTDLDAYFVNNGYTRVSTVAERGEFAVRGGLVDVFPPSADEPVRLDFFGDSLESIRSFDPETQRSLKQISQLNFTAVSEIRMDTDSISRFRQGYLAAFGAAGDDPVYAALSSGIRRQGVEHMLPLFYDHLDSVFDYLPPLSLVMLDALAGNAFAERADTVRDAYELRVAAMKDKGGSAYRAIAPQRLYLDDGQWKAALGAHRVRRFEPFEGEAVDAIDLGGRSGRNFAEARKLDSVNLFTTVADHAQALAKQGKRVIFASWTDGSSDRLAAMLADHGLTSPRLASNWVDAQSYGVAGTKAKPIQRAVLPLDHGFETESLAVISETDILGDRLARPRKRRRAQNFLAEASSLSPGDLVVHIEHGIGRYEGLKTLSVNDAPHDCLELHYAAESKLYLPVENIDLLTRYGSDSDSAQLDRLGSASWQARKAKAKQKLREMADGLIQLAAARALREGAQIDPPSGLYDEFCAQFPYEETDDQLHAIQDVLEDLAKGQPMDRLICGDVGFGKTEVALRAAFVVAMSGSQVAIVCPTTLLARQHFKTFTQRFQGWPVRVRQLSRLVGRKDADETREGLKKGEIEIVIGTHALLSEQVSFKDLGLVIVDEEQHFGVKHKEKLKAFRADVHMMALSATPIPRTLQMALSGIRDMSIIATPPVDRIAVRTYVLPYDPVALREALLREKYRGGQAYYVVPRLSDLPDVADFLRVQVPEIRFVIGHGQLSPTALEDVMTAFYEGQYDVLLSTTIVESGLDVPTANTLIVHRADMFGLAQLYQIRGRVGRSKTRAFAYLTTPQHRTLSVASEKRLKVLQSLDNLGAGFQLASHDLDIRGGGNLLGHEQSGHIREIGVELYQQMLEDAVAELRQKSDENLSDHRSWSPQINAGAAIMIPEAYIPDLNIRLALYRRVSEAEKLADREALASELIDRFGPIPQEAEQLLKVVGIKGLCREANVAKLDVGPKGAVVTFRNDTFNNPIGLVKNIQSRPNDWKLRPDQKLLVRGEWPEAVQRLAAAEIIMKELARLAAA